MWTPIAAIFACFAWASPVQTPVPAGSRNAKIRNEPNASINDLFDGANIGDHIPFPFTQIDDRIADDLAGAVVGDIAAAVGSDEFDAGAREEFRGGEKIFIVSVAAHGDDVRMFDEQKLIRDFATLALGDQVLLESEGFGVADKTKIPDDARFGRRKPPTVPAQRRAPTYDATPTLHGWCLNDFRH